MKPSGSDSIAILALDALRLRMRESKKRRRNRAHRGTLRRSDAAIAHSETQPKETSSCRASLRCSSLMYPRWIHFAPRALRYVPIRGFASEIRIAIESSSATGKLPACNALHSNAGRPFSRPLSRPIPEPKYKIPLSGDFMFGRSTGIGPVLPLPQSGALPLSYERRVLLHHIITPQHQMQPHTREF